MTCDIQKENNKLKKRIKELEEALSRAKDDIKEALTCAKQNVLK